MSRYQGIIDHAKKVIVCIQNAAAQPTADDVTNTMIQLITCINSLELECGRLEQERDIARAQAGCCQ